ncbi:MAG: delta 1-pyrroline-5-carboxylate reductase [Pycnora praestabilis]|nr:MAG: delta 1-pyrroline-5-carboxylate reductase [Pycnora praestabilis]
MASTKENDFTLAVLGCGNMGTAILCGLWDSLISLKEGAVDEQNTPTETPSRFLACVHRSFTAEHLKTKLSEEGVSAEVWQGRNVEAAQASKVIILCCEPKSISEVLSEEGMRSALSGKLLLSIVAGASSSKLAKLLYGSSLPKVGDKEYCYIVRTNPNTASALRLSSTPISNPDPPLPPAFASLTTWVFESIGSITYLPEDLLNVGGVVAGSSPAFFALALEGVIEGAIAHGMDREQATKLIAQAMKGSAELVLHGQSPKNVWEKVATPGGGTAMGLDCLRKGRVQETFKVAVEKATTRLAELGQ